MAAVGNGASSNAGRIAARLDTWPGVFRTRADCGVGAAVAVGGGLQIMHLHTGDEAELRLTRPVIERLGAALAGSGRVLVRPGQEWVVVRLDTESDINLVISLVSVAIKASDPAVPAARAPAPCWLALDGRPARPTS